MKSSRFFFCFAILIATIALAQDNPVPLINQPLVPDTTAPGGPEFTLTVNGTGFVSHSVINWNNSGLGTQFVSSSQLTATVPAEDIATASTAWVTVVNPAPGGGTSNLTFFPVTANIGNSLELGVASNTATDGNPSVVVGDFNGDGKLDLAVTNPVNNTVSILLGDGTGNFMLASSPGVGGSPGAIAVGDFNGDGKLDLAVGNGTNDTVSILLGDGTGNLTLASSPGVGGSPGPMAAGDFNGDGNLDLVIVNSGGSVAVLLGDGTGNFTLTSSSGTSPCGPDSVAVGDFNGDGKLDLAVASWNNSTLCVLLGDGTGNFTLASSMNPGPQPHSVVVADFNGDGKLDLAVANMQNTLSILLGDGTGNFTLASSPGTDTFPTSVAVGDFNGDGKLDLAVSAWSTQWSTSTVAVLLGDGTGNFTQGSSMVLGGNPNSLVMGDFSGNGNLGLAVENCANDPYCNPGQVSILLVGNPTVALSPTSLNFGTQTVGTTSTPQVTTLTNTSVFALNITSIGITGANSGDFAQTNNCPSSVPAKGSCNISVTFTPSTTGTRNAAVSIADNALNSPQTVPLTGVGASPAVTFSPSSLNFGNQTVNTTSSPQVSTLTNTGPGVLNITSIGMSGANSGDFAESNNCPSSVQPNGSCQISVTFTPSGTGTENAAVSITDNAPGSPQTMPLTGVGVLPAVTFSPSSLNFGNQGVGTTSSPQVTTLTNSGAGVLTITSIGITGSNSGDFAQTNNCPSSVQPNGSCQISVTFTPTGTGTRNAAVSVADNAPGSPQTVPLSGVGMPPGVTFSPTSLNFPVQVVSTTSPAQPVTLTNTGTGVLKINRISVTGEFSQANNCPRSLNPGAYCTINVRFRPTDKGVENGSVNVKDNAPGSPQQVPLTGTGTYVRLVPTKLNFGTQPVGTRSAARQITLTNRGNETLNITKISITGADAGDFAETNTCGHQIAPGASCFLKVRFKPLEMGKRTADVSISDDGGGSPQQDPLIGTGK